MYNFEVDGYPAKILNEANFSAPVDSGFFVADTPVLKRALHRRFEDDSTFLLQNNILYIDMDGEGVLVDTGSGPEGGAIGPGLLFDLLESEGISRDSIRHVLLTHGHHDHLGGVVEDMVGLEPAFPNAVVHISRTEYEYWTADTVRTPLHRACFAWMTCVGSASFDFVLDSPCTVHCGLCFDVCCAVSASHSTGASPSSFPAFTCAL